MRIDQSNVYRVHRPRGRSQGSQPDVVIVCHCGATDSIASKGNTPTECIGDRFRHRGWQVDAAGKKAVCRECQMKKTANGSAPTTAAVSSLVAAVRLLDAHFDIDSGSYAAPWSDAAIAGKVDLSEPAITSLRENDYGSLSVDPEVERFGTKMMRVAIPPAEDDGQTITQLYGGSSIYALTFTDEEIATAVARSNQQRPVEAWSARRMLQIDERRQTTNEPLELDEAAFLEDA